MTEKPMLAMAVVVATARLLLIRRAVPEGGLLWALPGGSVEAGETACQAAVREALEETGLAVEAVADLGERIHPDTDRRIVYVACRLLAGDARPASLREVAEIAWVTPVEVPQYVPQGLFPAVQEHLARLAEPDATGPGVRTSRQAIPPESLHSP
ncbi:NUDIX domain-containing protein [Streptomyces sp. NPDC049744]|uniref:NUDIX hydrolase n=1 Tax=Streptomyces sp. NPDC049744 TaxID=3154359 RepID=UPI00342CFAC6